MIPLSSNSIDIVISQTVIEHVEPKLLENYYFEQARVLVEGGKAYHDIPVKLNLYDSHTNLWLLHQLPRPLWLFLLGLLRGNERKKWAQEALFLRQASKLKRISRSAFGTVDDITAKRLIGAISVDHFLGSNFQRSRRKVFSMLFQVPVFGGLLAFLMAPFVMMTVVLTKINQRN